MSPCFLLAVLHFAKNILRTCLEPKQAITSRFKMVIFSPEEAFWRRNSSTIARRNNEVWREKASFWGVMAIVCLGSFNMSCENIKTTRFCDKISLSWVYKNF